MNSNEKNTRTIAFLKIADHINSKTSIIFDDKSKMIEVLSSKFKPDLARTIIDLWLGKDPLNKDSMYYNEHEAYMVACEEIVEKLESKDEIFRSKYDELFLYKERVDTKKVFLKAIKTFLVLKNLLYMCVLLLIGHMVYSYYLIPNKSINSMFFDILLISSISIFLLYQVNKNMHTWAIFTGNIKSKIFSYYILILGILILYIMRKESFVPSNYFYLLITIVVGVTIILLVQNNQKIEKHILYVKYMMIKGSRFIIGLAVGFFFLAVIFKSCTSSYEEKNKLTSKKNSDTEYKKQFKNVIVKPTAVKNNLVDDVRYDDKISVLSPTEHLENIKKEQIKNKKSNTAIFHEQSQTKIAKKNLSCSYYITTVTVNVRNSPSTNARINSKVQKSKKVCITENAPSWMYIKNKGWVYNKFLIKESDVKNKKKKKAKVKKYVDRSVWYCSARSERASGWVEKVGKQNAIRGALHQCEIRRQTSSSCKIVNCYKR